MKSVVFFCIYFILICAGVFAKESYNILVVHSYHADLPWTESLNEGLYKMKNEHSDTIVYFHEYMDMVRISTGFSPLTYKNYLEEKYRSIRIDAAIGDSDTASLFIRDYGDFLGDIPRVLYTGIELSNNSITYCLVSQYETSLKRTMDLILNWHENIQTIVLIKAVDPSGALAERILKPYVEGLRPDIIFRNLEFNTIEDLYRQTDALETGAVILYTPVIYDSLGNFLIPKEIINRVADGSAVPVYTFWSSLIGKGVIGGYVTDGSATGYEMIRAVLDNLKTGRFGDDYNNLRYIFDWDALRKYNIPLNTLPKEARIIDKPVPIFVSHFQEVTIGLAGLIGVFLIVSLFWVKSISSTNQKLKEANRQIEEARRDAENLARHDTLTGLLNRRAILPIIRYEISRKHRMSGHVSMLILDIDHFKRVNDSWGHEAGDRVLKSISKVCVDVSRATDRVARWGGEEFVILAPDTSGKSALILAEKIRIHIMKMHFGEIGSITISTGIAELKRHEDFGSWFQRADNALYEAKTAGRNKCVLAVITDPDSPEESNEQLLDKLYLRWHIEYSSGNKIIDDQHKQLMAVLNTLIDLIITEKPDGDINQCVETLSSLVNTHFGDEEKILQKLQFGELESHRAKHEQLSLELKQHYHDMQHGYSDIYTLLRFLSNDLILNHLLKEDFMYFHLTR